MDIPSFVGKGDPNCVFVDPELFFPDYPKGKERAQAHAEAEAKKVCDMGGGCVYKDECLAYATYNDEEGVWGGATQKERRKMLRRHLRLTPVQSSTSYN